MGSPVGILKKTMTHEEFQNWIIFDAETPIDDLHTHHLPSARVAWQIANSNRNRQQHPEPYPLNDFLPPWWDLDDGVPAEPIPADEMREKLQIVKGLVNDK